jgi:hypothetical protein
LPGDRIVCTLGEAIWNQCTCSWDWPPDAPVNAPAGAFLPGPQTGPIGPVIPTLPTCSETLPLVPIGAPTPMPAPGPTSPNTQHILVQVDPGSGDLVEGLLITCAETGVTQAAVCGGVGAAFYQADANLKNYSTPGGGGTDCTTFVGHSYSSASGENSSNLTLILLVTQE